MKLLIRWLTTSMAVCLVPYLISGVRVESFGTALTVALIFGLLNLLVKPILFIITLPITLLTLGLFSFVLNAFLLQLTAHLVRGFSIEGFWAAFFASLLISFTSWVLQLSIGSDEGRPHIRVQTSSRGRQFRDVTP